MYLSTCVIKIIGKYNHDYAYAKCEMSYAIKCISQKNPGRPPECWAFEARSRFALGRSNSTFSCTCQNLIIRLDKDTNLPLVRITCSPITCHPSFLPSRTLSRSLVHCHSFFCSVDVALLQICNGVFIPLLIYNFLMFYEHGVAHYQKLKRCSRI